MEQLQEAGGQISQTQQQTPMRMGKGIAIILGCTLIFALIGFGIGKLFFWDQYNKGSKLEIELQQNIETVKKDPNNPMGHLSLGINYTKNGDYERAIGEFKKVLSLDPKNAAANYYLGTSHIALKQYDKAISALSENIESTGARNFASHLNLAIAYYYTERYEDALKELEVSHRLNPGAPLSKYWTGMVYEKQNKLEDALREFQDAALFNPNDQGFKAAVERLTKALNK
jgi:tetratricopeptide (TPR) repeat protein